jgi:hypothetical protein
MEGWRFRKSERSACWNAPSILIGFLSRSRGGVGRARQRRDAAHRKDSAGNVLGIASRLIPQQVAVDLQASLPGNLSMEDWMIMREVMEAVRQAIPDASSQQPGAVLEHVLGALRQADAKTGDCPENDRS